MRKLLALLTLALLVLAALPAAAQEDELMSITEFMAEDDRYSTLLAAVEVADPVVLETLSEGGPVTLFAPTNQAFANLAAEFDFELEALLQDQALVTALLLYHVVNGAVVADDVFALDGQLVNPLLPNTAFNVTVEGSRILLNDIVRVIEPFDVIASNGVIHTLADVMFPFSLEDQIIALADVDPAAMGEADDDEAEADDAEAMAIMPEGNFVYSDDVPEEPQTEIRTVATFPSDLTLAGRILSDVRYSFLEQVMLAVAPDYLDILNDPEGEYTLFAPNNGAFSALLASLGLSLEDALDQPQLLREILAYHVLPGIVTSDDLADADDEVVETVLDNGEFVESIGVTVSGSRILLNEIVQVKSSDLLSTNGIMHSIDQILLPQVVLDQLIDLGIIEAGELGS
ncbi:MAG: fasciclin domain-containing protein [Chloroflexota bacterium]